jgi:Ca2+-binding RTX toxin-like protein
MTNFRATAVDDHLTGTYGGDYFNLAQGGDDRARGASGNDTFSMEASMTSADRIDGGAGSDTVYLDGDYSAGLTILAATVTDVEGFYFFAGFDYDITLADGVNRSPYAMTIAGNLLGAGDSLRFNGAKETSSSFSFYDGAGDDQLIGGGGSDSFNLSAGGADVASGGDSVDSFVMNGELDRYDRLNGGEGRDALYLAGDYDLAFRPNTVRFIEAIYLADGHDYRLRLNDNTIASGDNLSVLGYQLTGGHTAMIDASRELDGDVLVTGAAGRDTFIGGGGDDQLQGAAGGDSLSGGDGDDYLAGGGGFDRLTGGAGEDTFYFLDGDIPAGNPDLITDLALSDIVDISQIDADTNVTLNQGFTLVSHFTHSAGQLVVDYDPGDGVTHILMDTDGDAVADLTIDATGNHAGFTQFVL